MIFQLTKKKKNLKLKNYKMEDYKMLQGIFLIRWDNQMGSTIEAKFPPECEIQNNRITQYLVTLQSFGKQSNIQIKEENNIVLIYGYPGTTNYDFIIVLLDRNEEGNIYKIQSKLTLEGENILKTSFMKRKKVFLEFAKQVFKQDHKKIVFMGYPNSGKTTTKQFFFEQIQSEKLLETTLTPTKGIESNYYSLIDSNVVMFDTSGQEIERWYNIDETPLIGADLTIFFITAMDWIHNPTKVKSDLKRLVQFSEQFDEIEHELVLFCHKFDEITEDIEEFKQSLKDFTQPIGISAFFTSIKNAGNFDLQIGYQLMLRKFSPLFTFISNFLKPLMNTYHQKGSLFFLLDGDFKPFLDFTLNNEPYDLAKTGAQLYTETISKWMEIFSSDGGEVGDFITFTLEGGAKIVVCARISKFSSDFSYVIMQTDSYRFVDEIYREYEKLKEQFSWVTHVN